MSEYTTISSAFQRVSSTAVNEPAINGKETNHKINQEFWQPLSIQCKLSIGAVDDPLEHEADAMADKVMRMPETSFIQRKCAECEEEKKVQRKPLTSFIQRKCLHCEEKEKAQRKPLTPFIQKKEAGNSNIASNTVTDQIHSTKGSGNPMPETTRSFMESRSLLSNEFDQ